MTEVIIFLAVALLTCILCGLFVALAVWADDDAEWREMDDRVKRRLDQRIKQIQDEDEEQKQNGIEH